MAYFKTKDSEPTYVGQVVGQETKSTYHDDYYYMIVWDVDDEKGELVFDTVMYATTAAYTDGWMEVDAPKEIIEYYKEMQLLEARQAEIETMKRNVKRGNVVEVVKGRKVPVGTIGTVFWKGYSYGERVGLETESGERFFTAKSNVEVVLS